MKIKLEVVCGMEVCWQFLISALVPLCFPELSIRCRENPSKENSSLRGPSK
jgi:hypothetical protein